MSTPICALALLVLSSPSDDETARRAMTVDDALEVVGVGNVLLSTDGEWVFYSKTELDWKENNYESEYYLVPASGEPGDAFRFIGEAGGGSFQFSPDGRYLSLVRKAEDNRQVFRMRFAGGEAVQLTEHERGVRSYRWSQDSERIFFTAAMKKSKPEEQRQEDGYDAIFVDEGPNGQERGEWVQLWMFDLASEEETLLTEGEILVGDFAPSPDGQRVAFSARFENRRNQGNLSEVYVLNVADKVRRRLTENESPEGGLSWSPSGDAILCSAPSDGAWELRHQKFWLLDPESGEQRLISGNFAGSPRRAVWSEDGGALYFAGQQGVDTDLWRFDLGDGGVERLCDLDGSVGSPSFSQDRSRVAYTFADFDSPADVYVADLAGFEPRRLTEANPQLDELLLANTEVLRWRSSDGLEIEGLLYTPASWREGQRLPLMLNIHGGPAGVFSNSFRASYHVYAGLGYASLCPNVRGSSGYTDELLRGNMGDIGGGDYWDLMTGVDALIERGLADPERLGVKGWSYGGILGGWTITQTDRFRAASLGAMVADWTSEYGPGFNHDVRLWYIGGTPWERPEDWREKSALTHIAEVVTPTILFHGIEDTTDTEPQSMMYFAALKDRGIDCRYLRFPRAGHGLGEPRHRRTRDVEELAWMQKYVNGAQWSAPERPGGQSEDESK